MAADPGRPVLRVRGLSKRFGRALALDGLDLVVQPGEVVGLAGPNGAGKSVTFRILLGLVRPTAGVVELFGEPIKPGARALARVGALVDGPGFVPHLSGLDNLRLAWRLTGRPEAEAGLGPALELAGLGEAIRRPYRTYSHGMRYRLGLAQALLGRPDLLVLDEPATGLDPGHLRVVRAAVASAVERGATVLLSSHVLPEIESLCTHAAVLQQGRLVAAGRIADLVGPAAAVHLEVDDPDAATAVLSGLPGVCRVARAGDALGAVGEGLRPAALFAALDEAGVGVLAFRRGRTLEQAYLDLLETAGEPGSGRR
ncbi:MAG TPA: ABC transporter ATP-binding protein [Candidatus Dormibacteraeota bacterium]|nr:ABC transporter ATP-binding protein [Candidatus Dormibacteraeota bacterium]